MGNARRALFVLAISALLALNNAAFARELTAGPAQPGVASKTISVRASTLGTQGHSCDSSEWHFVINQIAGGASQAPGSIFVTWSNGASASVPRSAFTGATISGVAHYTTTANLGSTVTGATATIYDAWSGEFVLSHGPCVAPTPTPPTPTPPTPTPPTPTPPTPTPPTPTPPTPTPPTPTPPTPTPPTVGSLVVSKYHDLDRDGVRDSGEPGIQGYVFVVHTIGNSFVTTLTTNASGLATLTGLAAGMYVVTEIQQPGWFSTDPGGVIPTKTATVASGQTSLVSFGNAQIIIIPPTSAGRLIVTKYNDLNANGRRDAGEPALAGWSFTVRNNGATIAAATTGSDGTATFSDLVFGSYTVVEVTQSGWLSSDPGGTAPAKTVQISSATTNVAFGNFQPRLPNTASGGGQPPLDTLALLGAVLLAHAVIAGLALRRRSARLSGYDLS